MTVTKQAIPDYVYMEVADAIAESIKAKTEHLVTAHEVRVGGTVTCTSAFVVEFEVLEAGATHGPVKVEFKT